MNDTYFYHVASHYKPFFDYINNIVEANEFRSVADMGCGPAFCARVLAEIYDWENKADISCFDKDLDVLLLAQRNTEKLYHVDCWEMDLLKPWRLKGHFDLVYSHGLLEHFSNRNIRKILEYQKTICGKVIHYVPGALYKTPSFGDERLISLEKWQKLFKPDFSFQFNGGYDYVLVWNGAPRELVITGDLD
jgi:SAM-dependent methyltransferase